MGRPCTVQRIENALASKGGLRPNGLTFAQFYHVVEGELQHSRALGLAWHRSVATQGSLRASTGTEFYCASSLSRPLWRILNAQPS